MINHCLVKKLFTSTFRDGTYLDSVRFKPKSLVLGLKTRTKVRKTAFICSISLFIDKTLSKTKKGPCCFLHSAGCFVAVACSVWYCTHHGVTGSLFHSPRNIISSCYFHLLSVQPCLALHYHFIFGTISATPAYKTAGVVQYDKEGRKP